MEEMWNQPFQPSDIPLLPLPCPLIPLGDEVGTPLPIFSHHTEIPVSGMGSSLEIFNPEFRDVYHDAMSSWNRRFMMPLAHPYHAGRYAKYGWVFQIHKVKDFANFQ